MQRAEHYPDPLNFNGFRFADPKIVDTAIAYSMSQPNPSKLVDLDSSWNVWGTGRMAWYVSHSIANFRIVED
jgi:hypothetical protein